MASNTPVSLEETADVISAIQRMTVAEKEALVDEFYREQPIILANALIVAKADVPGEVRDEGIDLALMLFRCLRSDLQAHGPITETQMERCIKRHVAMCRFLEGENGADFHQSTSSTFQEYPERNLLAWIMGRLNELKVEDADVIMALKTMLDACVEAKWGLGQAHGS